MSSHEQHATSRWMFSLDKEREDIKNLFDVPHCCLFFCCCLLVVVVCCLWLLFVVCCSLLFFVRCLLLVVCCVGVGSPS